MKLLGKVSGVWVLAIILGLTGASCAVQATTDHRPPTADRRLLSASEPDVATKAKIQTAYGRLPLHLRRRSVSGSRRCLGVIPEYALLGQVVGTWEGRLM